MSLKIKTCIFGNSSVGKTCILIRIHQGIFNAKTSTSVGVDFRSQTKKINGEEVLVELWDTTGQEKYRSVVSNFSKDAQGVFLVFDITNDKSLTDLEFWLNKLHENVDEKVPKVLLANKIDLKKELSENQENVLKELCAKYELTFFKVSAKTGFNIKQAYNTLLEASYHYAFSHRTENKTQPILIESKFHDKKGNKKQCCK